MKHLSIINDISYFKRYLRSKKLDKEDEFEVMEKIIILNDFRIEITENMIIVKKQEKLLGFQGVFNSLSNFLYKVLYFALFAVCLFDLLDLSFGLFEFFNGIFSQALDALLGSFFFFYFFINFPGLARSFLCNR